MIVKLAGQRNRSITPFNSFIICNAPNGYIRIQRNGSRAIGCIDDYIISY